MAKITILKNGIKLLTEHVIGAQSTYVGVWVKAGSANEKDCEWGISHFVEHMLFKGTQRRTARQISEEVDYVGGQANAFTTRDCTCYYSRTLPENMELSFDILSDIYHNPKMARDDIELERSVIKEEIMMCEDCSEDLVQDRLLAAMYPNSPIGREIAGSIESVDAMTGEQLGDYMARYYTPDNTIVSVSGKFNEEDAIALCEKYFGESVATFAGDRIHTPTFVPVDLKWEKDIEQAHLSLAFPSISLKDSKMSFALLALSNIFGGSMSSRLFNSIREERGLCYSVYSYSTQWETAGHFGIYTGLNESCLCDAESLIHEEIALLLKDGITDRELERGKAQLKAANLMDAENPYSVMSDLAKDLLIYNELRPVDTVLKLIDSITKKDVNDAAHLVFEQKHARGILLPSDR